MVLRGASQLRAVVLSRSSAWFGSAGWSFSAETRQKRVVSLFV